jgi:hypothetical protein
MSTQRAAPTQSAHTAKNLGQEEDVHGLLDRARAFRVRVDLLAGLVAGRRNADAERRALVPEAVLVEVVRRVRGLLERLVAERDVGFGCAARAVNESARVCTSASVPRGAAGSALRRAAAVASASAGRWERSARCAERARMLAMARRIGAENEGAGRG